MRVTQSDEDFRCQWVKMEDGTNTLIPGCWNRVHDPDADCTCGEWSEDIARETIRHMQAQVYRLGAEVQQLREVLRRHKIEHPTPEYWRQLAARQSRRAMHKRISAAAE